MPQARGLHAALAGSRCRPASDGPAAPPNSLRRSHAFYELILAPAGLCLDAERAPASLGWSSNSGSSSGRVDGSGGGGGSPRPGSMLFVDLAGMERAADSASHDSERQLQSAEINSGLSTLKVGGAREGW